MWDNNSGVVDISAVDTNALTFLLTGLDQGLDYKFKVRGRNVYGYGEKSEVVTIRASDVPDAMQTVNVVSASTELTIFWLVPADGGDAITEY